MILKNLKQLLRRPMTLLVTSYCLTITYDRAGFIRINHWEIMCKNVVFSSQGVRTHPTHIVCRRHCDPCEPFRPCSVNSIQHFSCPSEHWQLTATITKTFCTRPSWLSDLGYFLHFFHTLSRFALFLSASLYFSKRGAYWDRLCRDVVGRCFDARALWPNGTS